MATGNEIQRIIAEVRELAQTLGIAETRVEEFARNFDKLNNISGTSKIKQELLDITQLLADLFTGKDMVSGQSRIYTQIHTQIMGLESALRSATEAQKAFFQSINANAPSGIEKAGPELAPPAGESAKKTSAEVKESTEEIQQSWARMGELVSKNNPFITSEQAAAKLQTTFKSLGINLDTHVIKGFRDGTTQITRFVASTKDGGPNIDSFILNVNRIGKITADVSDKLNTFTGRVTKSIAQFTRWSIAAALVALPMRVLGQEFKRLIQNESELANIGIILGNSQDKLATAFEAVADAAYLSGESIEGVLEGYSQALRATGNLEGEYLRISVANELLTDSLVLSKLSTFNQAQAMDTLVASLRQAGIPLSDGVELLDMWVATTKIANVDLRTLAESYAIVGSVAKSAGIEIGATGNELVGLIAVLAEQTQLTATETGNALRAVITGISTSAAADELRSFGVSVTDINGKTREFLDISEDISRLYSQGLIDDAQLSAISRAIGGGTRRQAQVEVVLKNLARAQEINAASANSSGAAYEAVAIQVDTLQSAITNLGNALQELMFTWGGEGGLLEIAEMTVEILTGLVKIVESLTGAMGPSFLALLGVGAFAQYGKSGKGPFGPAITSTAANSMLFSPAGGIVPGQRAGLASSAGKFGQQALLGGLALSANVAAPALRGDTDQAVGGLVGTVVGGIIGGLSGPGGAVIGMSIGGSIGNAFINFLELESGKLIDILSGADDTEDITKKNVREAELSKQIATEIGGGSAFLGNLKSTLITMGIEVASWGSKVGLYNNVPSEIISLASGDATQEKVALQRLQLVNPTMYNEFQGEFDPTKADTTFNKSSNEFMALFGQELGTLQKELLSSTTEMATTGEISGREVETRRTVISGLDATLSQIFGISKSTSSGVKITPESIESVAQTYITATAEQKDTINSMTNTIQNYQTLMDDAIASGEREVAVSDNVTYSLAELDKETKALASAQAAYIEDLRRSQKYETYDKPSIVSANTGGFSKTALQMIMARAQQYERKYEEGMFGGDDELIDSYRETISDVVVEFENGVMIPLSQLSDELYDLPASARSFRKAIEDAIEEGFVIEDNRGNAGFLDVPFTSTDPLGQSILGGSLYQQQLAELSETEVYEEDLSNVIVTYSDKTMEAARLDATIIQMLLGSIVDNTEDMVDGIYNLPTDGTFYVPFAGYQVGFANSGGINMSDLLGYLTQNIGAPLNQIVSNTAEPVVVMSSADTGYEMRSVLDDGYSGLSEPFEYDPSLYKSGHLQSSLIPGTAAYEEAQKPDESLGEYLMGPFDMLRELQTWFNSLFQSDSHSKRLQKDGDFNPKGEATSIESILTSSLGTMMDALNSQPVEVKIDITAMFETFLDGESVATVSKKYIADELVRKGTSQGVNISSVV